MKIKPLAILTSMGVFSVLSIFQLFGWFPLKYLSITGPISFMDLASVLGSADCYRRIGFEIYEYSIGHVCAYNYGSFLMYFISYLGLGKNETIQVGFMFIFLFAILVGLAVYILRISRFRSFIFLGFVIFSPPILLLLERGNLDILIYILILISALVYGWQKIDISLGIIFLSALFKFYPLVLFFFIATLQRVGRLIPYLAIAVLGVLQILQDFGQGPGFINTVQLSFGGPVAGLYLGYLGVNLPYVWSIIFGVFLLLLAITSIYYFSRSTALFTDLRVEMLFPNSYLREIYLFNLVVHITCYVLGMSFDYRLVFLVTSCVLLIFSDYVSKFHKQCLASAVLIILWTSANILFLQLLGDIVIGILTAFFVVQVFQYWYLKQNKTLRVRLERFVRFPLHSQK